jgi:hypothetical protein
MKKHYRVALCSGCQPSPHHSSHLLLDKLKVIIVTNVGDKCFFREAEAEYSPGQARRAQSVGFTKGLPLYLPLKERRRPD